MNISKKIIPINKPDLSNYKKENIPHKFLYNSLKKEIFVYINNKNNEEKIYDFFGVYFLFISENIDIKSTKFISLYDRDGYKVYYENKNLDDIEISQKLRGSKTLKVTDKNSYDNDDIKAIFSEKGFLVCNKMAHIDENKFERVLILYMLALAYIIKAQNLLQDVSQAHEDKSFEKMIILKDDVYSFDLNCYFFNPVLQNRHQVFNIWQIISKCYFVKEVYHEVKTQVSDLTKIIEHHRKEEQEKREKSLDRKLTYIGIFIGIMSAISAIPVILDFFK
ncbi:hypothetical protein NG774_09700 [Aliarcobacter cryaerophilus]|uniref:hypothetical protein n=1 Tax=Aliarcobacter cryaerophilus TaxID=28198 RepID=UPI003DA438DD